MSQGDIHTSKISRCLGLWLAIKKNMVTIRFGGPSNEKGCESETFLTLIWRPSRPTSKIQVFDLNTSDQTLLSIPFLYLSPVFLQCDLASVALSWLVGFWQRQFNLNTLGIFCHIHTIQTLCIMESLLCCVLEKSCTVKNIHQGKSSVWKSLIFCWNNPILVKCWRPRRTLCWLDLAVWWNSWRKIHTAIFFHDLELKKF